MSRGLGRVQRFVLGFLADQDRPDAAAPGLGYSAREIAAAMAAGEEPTRSAVVSVGRAMRELQAEGLVDIWVPNFRRQGSNLFARLPADRPEFP